MREDSANRRSVDRRVTLFGHSERGRRVVAAIEGAAEGPAAAGRDDVGLVERVEDVVCSEAWLGKGSTVVYSSASALMFFSLRSCLCFDPVLMFRCL